MKKIILTITAALLLAACGGDEPSAPACAVDKEAGDCVNKCADGASQLGETCVTAMGCECGLTCAGDPKVCVQVDSPCSCEASTSDTCQFDDEVHCPNKCGGGEGTQGESCEVTDDCSCGFKCFSGECTPFTGALESCLCNDVPEGDTASDTTGGEDADTNIGACAKPAPAGAVCNPYCNLGCGDAEHCSYFNGEFSCMPFGDLPLDEACGSSQVCQEGSACFGVTGGSGDTCKAFCIDDDSCPVGRKCDLTVNFTSGAASFCGDITVGCDPFALGNSCGDGAACYVDNTATKCMPAGDLAEGEVCSGANSCEAGLHCLIVCTKICALNPGQEPSCNACGSPLYSVAVTDEPAGANCEFGGKKGTGAIDMDGANDDVAYGCNGEPGPDAPSEIVTVTSEEAGENCPLGGKKIRVGVDENQDGTLADDEVETTAYACHVPPMTGGATAMAMVLSEPAGANCSAGGKKVQTGTDENANGILDEEETDDTSYACNTAPGEPGFQSLAKAISEPSGANCDTGGKKIETGPDSNANGILDDDEVDYTGYSCNTDNGDGLAKVADEAAGDNCADGGKAVSWGADANFDGSLGDDEVTGTHYACHQADGSEGVDALATLSAEPAGDNCTYGGKKIATGGDDDQNGTLGDAEVDNVSYACDATPEGIGAEAIVSVSDEPAGDDCTHGGKLIDAGVDGNSNGQLDDDEKTDAWYACAGLPGELGPAGMVMVETLETGGAECANGGKKFAVGVDTDGNGALTGGEITSETVGCNGPAGSGGGEFDTISPENGVGLCLTEELPAACDIFYQTGCAVGQKCTFMTGGVGCAGAGPVGLGEACGGSAGGCVAGGLCVNSTCGEICDASADAPADVSCEEKCSSMSNITPAIWGVGICTDQGPAVTCDFWAQDCEDPTQNCYYVTGGATCLTPNGDLGEGAACASLQDCGQGFTCAGGTCVRPCSMNEFDTNPAAEICADVCEGTWSPISQDAGVAFCD
jgi:hypothetical protein